MKRIWNLALGTAVLCTVLLCGCALSGTTAPDSAAPTDPLTGQELQYPGERTAAVVIDNAASSTTQWGIGSASVVLAGALSMTTAATRSPGYCSSCPVSGSAGAEPAGVVLPLKVHPHSSAAHSTAVPRARFQMRFMLFPRY